ncbi:hypothetical protein [Rhizobium leguminosarum]|uniref:hypothetical protein n=1 Tax=Rhizobium leguminosarum TaxID=384 RepID=UPI000486F7CA|nr:hypothetical protein [Rhizobium leguminosarum]
MKGVELFPIEWRYVIQQILEVVAPGAILAGGALRDLNAGIPLDQIKDLDFFVPAHIDMPGFEKSMKRRFDYAPVHRCNAYFMKGSDGTIGHSVMFRDQKTFRPMPDINIIWMTEGYEPIGRLHAFDFGICQIAFDGRQYHVTSAFHQDMANRTFTLIRADTPQQYERSLQRWERISPRYDGWRLIIPRPLLERYNDIGMVQLA